METPNYLFRFFNIQKRQNNFVYLDKLNSTSNRFDLFSLDLPNELDINTGSYKYFIYESADDVSTDYENMVLLEEGRAEVVKDFPESKFYTINTTDNINYV